jgi:hypothetical protein
VISGQLSTLRDWRLTIAFEHGSIRMLQTDRQWRYRMNAPQREGASKRNS